MRTMLSISITFRLWLRRQCG
ncbi:hypothetical protein PMI38_02640, partial [Pseudomonas sp. GM84]